jgi:hypothetical protein
MLGCLPVEAERATAAVFRPHETAGSSRCSVCVRKRRIARVVLGDKSGQENLKRSWERESQSTESVPAAELMGCGTSGSIPKEHPRFLVVGPRPHPHVKLVLIILNSFPFLALCDHGRCAYTKVEPGSNNVCREDMTGVF